MRVRRRTPDRRAEPPRDTRTEVCRAYGWPPDVDVSRLADDAYRRDALDPYRTRIGWRSPWDPA